MILFFIFFACITLFVGFCVGWSAAHYKLPYNRQQYNPVVDEMRLQRARDYINNPVVNELKQEHDYNPNR